MLHVKITKIATPFVLNAWTEQDFENPLKITTPAWRTELFLIADGLGLGGLSNLSLLVYGTLEIYIDNPEEWLIAGLNQNTPDETSRAANFIFDIYKENMRQAVAYERMALDLHNIFEMNSRFDEIFDTNHFSMVRAQWAIDTGTLQEFSFAIPRTNERHPVFQDDKLVSPAKWLQLQNFIDQNPPPSKEIEELLRLKQKTAWNEKRIAAIESATIIEFILRKKVEGVLTSQGVSQNRIKDIKKEIGMSILLNLLIPLSISREEYEAQKVNIEKVDKLRKVRNEVIHDGLEEGSIDPLTVADGINSAINLISFLNSKFS
jgi:hypothetical protein